MAQLPPFQEMESLNLLPGGGGGGVEKEEARKGKQASKKKSKIPRIGLVLVVVLFSHQRDAGQ